jgi:hypothetical protein
MDFSPDIDTGEELDFWVVSGFPKTDSAKSGISGFTLLLESDLLQTREKYNRMSCAVGTRVVSIYFSILSQPLNATKRMTIDNSRESGYSVSYIQNSLPLQY